VPTSTPNPALPVIVCRFLMSALILIDLQNDFLAPSAPFKVDPKSQKLLRNTLKAMIPTFRDSGGHIIWVKSHYAPNKSQTDSRDLQGASATAGPTPADLHGTSSSPQNTPLTQYKMTGHLEWVLEGTHTGKKPCCQEGTYGAELASWTDTLRQPEDVVLIKTFFSAFKETRLEEILVERNINTLYIGGLLSNMCVLATSINGTRIISQNGRNWEVFIITDGLAWRREESHRRALGTMEEFGVRLIGSEVLSKS